MLNGFSNGYIVADHSGSTACIVNPGAFDTVLLETLEAHRLYPAYVLVTTPEPQHTRGIETLLRIYDAAIYAGDSVRESETTHVVADGDSIAAGDMNLEVIGLSAYRPDAMAFLWNGLLFPGTVLQAGTILMGEDMAETIELRRNVRERLLTLSEETLVLPSLGPPTTIGAERLWNIDTVPD
jgi:glyoxylase-like metal-dependent hydrolase (beta-lactamase superfamily II)